MLDSQSLLPGGQAESFTSKDVAIEAALKDLENIATSYTFEQVASDYEYTIPTHNQYGQSQERIDASMAAESNAATINEMRDSFNLSDIEQYTTHEMLVFVEGHTKSLVAFREEYLKEVNTLTRTEGRSNYDLAA